jgi:ABC-type glycerol-3-phosphate transport system substrate-binding protein
MKTTSKIRTVVAGGAALALTAVLLGCSAGSGGTEPMSAEPSGTLKFPSHFWADNTAWAIQLRDLFVKTYPAVTVDAAPIPFPDYHNKTYTDMAAGQAPDIVVPYDPQIGQWAREGLLEPLDTCLADNGIKTADLIPPQQVAQMNGKTYGLLYYSNPRVLVYNKQMFDKAGLTVPADVNALQTAIGKLRDPATQQFGFATVTGSESPAATYLDIMPIIAGFGGAFVTNGKATANSAQVVEALEFLRTNVANNTIPKGATQAGYRDAFIAGKVGSVAIGGFIVGTALTKNPAVGKVLDAAPLPFPSGKTIAVNVFLSIPAGARNKAAACKYIAMSLNPAIQEAAAAGVNGIPATGLVSEAFLQQSPFFRAVLDAAKVAVSYAPQGAEKHTAEVSQIVTDVYQEMLTTGLTARQAADKIQQKLDALLK